MIYASLNAKEGNYQYPAAIKTALDFLAKPETAELPVGRYELDGDNIFVLIQDQTTAPVENKRAESHRYPVSFHRKGSTGLCTTSSRCNR